MYKSPVTVYKVLSSNSLTNIRGFDGAGASDGLGSCIGAEIPHAREISVSIDSHSNSLFIITYCLNIPTAPHNRQSITQ